jgi:dihydrofolate reductase
MAKLQWQFTMSLDGFMAGPGGDMSWMKDYLGPNPKVDEVMEQTGALLVGNRTFRGDDPFKDTPQEGEPYGGGWEGPQFVLTHNPPSEQVEGVTFVSDLASGVDQAKAAAGEKYVGVLGAEVGRQCIEAGLLDEIFVSIAPVLLGDGVPVFDVHGRSHVKLERIVCDGVPDATNLWLRVVSRP